MDCWGGEGEGQGGLIVAAEGTSDILMSVMPLYGGL